MRIIYCDDESNQRELVSVMLEFHYKKHNSVRIETLQCAHELRSVEGNVSLLISDGNMRSSTYADVLRYRQERFSTTPIIIYSGDDLLVDKLQRDGISAVIKSSGITPLLEAIEKELRLIRR